MSWTDKDSIYGARRIASRWEKEMDQYQPGVKSSRLKSMKTLILMDLLGQKEPELTSQFKDTQPVFELMQGVERRLQDEKMLKGQGGAPTKEEPAGKDQNPMYFSVSRLSL